MQKADRAYTPFDILVEVKSAGNLALVRIYRPGGASSQPVDCTLTENREYAQARVLGCILLTRLHAPSRAAAQSFNAITNASLIPSPSSACLFGS